MYVALMKHFSLGNVTPDKKLKSAVLRTCSAQSSRVIFACNACCRFIVPGGATSFYMKHIRTIVAFALYAALNPCFSLLLSMCDGMCTYDTACRMSFFTYTLKYIHTCICRSRRDNVPWFSSFGRYLWVINVEARARCTLLDSKHNNNNDNVVLWEVYFEPSGVTPSHTYVRDGWEVSRTK